MKHPLLISVAVLALIMIGTRKVPAQQIDLSLNLLYADPMDDQSGGNWQVVGRADENGIMGVVVDLVDILNPEFHSPRGEVGGVLVGFEEEIAVDFGAYHELAAAQVPQNPGLTQPLFYDVGVIGGGTTPGDTGPDISLDAGSARNIPWGMADPLGSAAWNGAVLLFSGTFSPGTTPAFFGSGEQSAAGVVLTSVGSETIFGAYVDAAISTVVRNNLTTMMGIPGDYNDSGLVEQADLDLVLGNWGANAASVPPAWSNDLPAGFIDQDELDGVLGNWGANAPAVGAAGALGSSSLRSAQGVPEPSTLLLSAAVFIPWVIRRGGLGMGRLVG
jgi:hypothetical protein